MRFDDFVFNMNGDNAAMVQVGDQTADEDAPHLISVRAIDFDAGTVSLVDFSVTGGGTLSISGGSSALLIEGSDTTFDFTYDPGTAYQHLAVDETATETLSFTVEDGQGNTTVRTATLTIEGRNDAPEVDAGHTDTTGAVQEDTTLVATGHIAASDPDTSDSLSYSVVGGGTGAYGTLSVDAAGNWRYELANDRADVQALNSDDTMSDDFTVEISDGNGGIETVDISIDVAGLDDSAPGTLVNFDDLESATDMGEIPDGYGGLNWDGALFVETDEYRGGGGSPIHLGDVSVFNVLMSASSSAPVTISRAEDFDLESAAVMAVGRDGLILTAEARNDGVSLGSQNFLLRLTGPQVIEFDDTLFDSVDEVVFTTNRSSLAQFAMDDLLYFG